jgi:hypothetical protein
MVLFQFSSGYKPRWSRQFPVLQMNFYAIF